MLPTNRAKEGYNTTIQEQDSSTIPPLLVLAPEEERIGLVIRGQLSEVHHTTVTNGLQNSEKVQARTRLIARFRTYHPLLQEKMRQVIFKVHGAQLNMLFGELWFLLGKLDHQTSSPLYTRQSRLKAACEQGIQLYGGGKASSLSLKSSKQSPPASLNIEKQQEKTIMAILREPNENDAFEAFLENAIEFWSKRTRRVICLSKSE